MRIVIVVISLILGW
jgi:hypothetical protein